MNKKGGNDSKRTNKKATTAAAVASAHGTIAESIDEDLVDALAAADEMMTTAVTATNKTKPRPVLKLRGGN